jgi:hypothetical protein
MKFRPSEHKDITKIIERHNLDLKDFSFVKRKGRLHIHYKNQDPSFSFFRTIETKLVGNRFEEITLFKVSIQTELGIVRSWEEVLLMVNNWLTSLNK